MKRMILGAMAAALLSGCATEQVPSDYKAGDYVVTLTATSSKENAAFRAARICGDNAYRAFSYPRSINPSRGNGYYPEVWVCGRENGVESGNPIAIQQAEKAKEDKALKEISEVESLSSTEARNYFLKEKHAISTNCLVWGDIVMITGKYPAMIIAGNVDMGSRPKWDGKEFSFFFNGGSMIARFTPSESKHKMLIQAGNKVYGCGPSAINHDYD